jgi:hypothetical protein
VARARTSSCLVLSLRLNVKSCCAVWLQVFTPEQSCCAVLCGCRCSHPSSHAVLCGCRCSPPSSHAVLCGCRCSPLSSGAASWLRWKTTLTASSSARGENDTLHESRCLCMRNEPKPWVWTEMHHKMHHPPVTSSVICTTHQCK